VRDTEKFRRITGLQFPKGCCKISASCGYRISRSRSHC
jgi:hypothetical protein